MLCSRLGHGGPGWCMQDDGRACTSSGNLSDQGSYPLSPTCFWWMLMVLLMLAQGMTLFLSTCNCDYHSQAWHSLAFSILSGLLITAALHSGLWRLCRRHNRIYSHSQGREREVEGNFSHFHWSHGKKNNIGQQHATDMKDSDGRQQQWYLQAILYTSKLKTLQPLAASGAHSKSPHCPSSPESAPPSAANCTVPQAIDTEAEGTGDVT